MQVCSYKVLFGERERVCVGGELERVRRGRGGVRGGLRMYMAYLNC